MYLFVVLCVPVMISALTSQQIQETEATVRYRCRVTYDGTSFCGFQLQHDKKQRTVQGETERVLSARFNRLIRVVGAGRTDAGVHSRGQAVHFDLYRNETEKMKEDSRTCLEMSMNRMLPMDVRVWNVGQAPLPCEEWVNGRRSIHAWNVMRKCNAKLYSYRLCVGDSMDPVERYTRWQLDWGHEIDPKYLLKILKHFEGTHDFSLFANALEQNERKTGKPMSTIRTIHSVNLVHEKGDHYRIDVYLEGALYKMVRNIVGTALEVCRGRMSEEKFLEILHHPSRFIRKDNLAKPAPPQGLTLEHVFYPKDDF